MIAVRDEDIMVARRTSDGRFVLFTTTDVKPEWTLRRWGAVGDTGADGHGILARADALAAPSGWTTRQLMLVARRRLVAKGELCPLPATRDAVTALDQALACRWERGRPRARAACRCPDPGGKGVTAEQLLIVLDQLTHDAARAIPYLPALWHCRRHVKAALSAEARRLAAVRG
jgi:hypothetical protein